MECPKCSAQITGNKCSYCGYEVPKEKKPDYVNEITDSLGKIAGHFLSEYANNLTDDHSEKNNKFTSTSESDSSSSGENKEINTHNRYNTNKNYHIANSTKLKKKIVFCVVVIVFLFSIPFILLTVSGITRAFISGYDDYNSYADLRSGSSGKTEVRDLSGEYMVNSLDINSKNVIVTVDYETADFTVSGQAEEYIESMDDNLENTNCYLEAKDGVITILYKKSPTTFVIDDLGDNHYLITDGPDDFYEIISDTPLQYGKYYSSYYEWKEKTMKFFFAEEYDPMVPYSMNDAIEIKQEKTIVENTGNKQYNIYLVNVEGDDYMVSKNVYDKLKAGETPEQVRLDQDMNIMLID